MHSFHIAPMNLICSQQFVAKNPSLYQHAISVCTSVVQWVHATIPRRICHQLHASTDHHSGKHGSSITVPVMRCLWWHGRLPTLWGAHVWGMQRYTIHSVNLLYERWWHKKASSKTVYSIDKNRWNSFKYYYWNCFDFAILLRTYTVGCSSL